MINGILTRAAEKIGPGALSITLLELSATKAMVPLELLSMGIISRATRNVDPDTMFYLFGAGAVLLSGLSYYFEVKTLKEKGYCANLPANVLSLRMRPELALGLGYVINTINTLLINPIAGSSRLISDHLYASYLMGNYLLGIGIWGLGANWAIRNGHIDEVIHKVKETSGKIGDFTENVFNKSGLTSLNRFLDPRRDLVFYPDVLPEETEALRFERRQMFPSGYFI